MIGRGTRLRPDLYGPGEDKKDFFVFDLRRNFEYFDEILTGTEGSFTPSLSERLFTRRVELLARLDEQDGVTDGVAVDPEEITDGSQLRTATADTLAERVAGMNLDNILVRPRRRAVEHFGDRKAWGSTVEATLSEMLTLAGLPSQVSDPDEDAKRFDLLMLNLKLGILVADPGFDGYRNKAQSIATGLLEQTTIPAIAAQAALLDEVAGEEWWVDVTLPILERARRRLRSLIRLLEKTKRTIVYTDFADTLGQVIELGPPNNIPTGTNYERFKTKARAFLADHLDHVALQRLRRNQPLTPTDLDELQRMLSESGIGGPDEIHRATVESEGLGRFIRTLVGLDRAAATAELEDFVAGRILSGSQLEFVNLVIEYLTQHGDMGPGQLYDPPFTDVAPTGPEQSFPNEDIDRLVAALDHIRQGAGIAS